MKNKLNENITGVILSGGRSSRMGSNKAMLKIDGKTLIKRTIDLMKNCFVHNILITNEPEDYKFLGIDIFEDVIPHLGPLAGIHSGLVNSETEKIFVISCDMPVMKSEMINYIAGYKSDADIVIPSDGKKVQPLCGIYNRSILTLVESMLNNKELSKGKRGRSVYNLIEKVESKIIDVSGEAFFDPNLFFNLNSQNDYKKLEIIFDSK